MLEAKVKLADGMAFDVETPSGYHLTIDAAPDVGGQDKGPRPLELLLVALGGCTGMDVISILRKKRLAVTGYEVFVRAERAQEHPMVYTSIQVEHVVRGKNISPDAVARAIELSETKYCPASAMLRPGTNITSSYRIVEE
ncbi:MAG: OsmC family protein [Chloroflexi bacterium]|nr:OsmC family protein [Chloroflexota bacterium]MDA8187255.1 OsmC family protein [Dehalococcoidales bacterium]